MQTWVQYKPCERAILFAPLASKCTRWDLLTLEQLEQLDQHPEVSKGLGGRPEGGDRHPEWRGG